MGLRWLDSHSDEAAQGLDTIIVKIFKSLGDPGRIEILKLTNPTDKSFTELKQTLQIHPTTLSRNITALRKYGLLEKRKGRYIATPLGTRMLQVAREQVAGVLGVEY